MDQSSPSLFLGLGGGKWRGFFPKAKPSIESADNDSSADYVFMYHAILLKY